MVFFFKIKRHGEVVNMKFTSNGLEFCGKVYKYSRCTAKEIIEHQKVVEQEQEQYKPIYEEINTIEDELNNIDLEINAIKSATTAINRKADPSDEELEQVAQHSLNIIELSKERRQLNKKIQEMDKKHKKETEELRTYIDDKYAELATLQLEGMTPEIYLEKATDFDKELVRMLPSIRKMSEAGVSTKQIEKHVRDNIKADADMIVAQNKPSFQ